MYTPGFNAEHNLPTLRDFLRANPLCALVTSTAQGLVASHIPMVLHESSEEPGLGILRGHVARANPQWHAFTAADEALGIFTGPQHYISASWYPGKQTHGREVPTWNYVAVHAYGPLRAIEDPAWLLDHLRTLTDTSEVNAEIPIPWSVDDAPPGFIAKLTGGIVGLELPITRLEGKWKVSQNRTEADATAVIEGLDRLGTPQSAVMRDLVHSRRPR